MGPSRSPRCVAAKCLVGALLVLLQGAFALDNGLGKSPPLAYSSWNAVGPAVNESFIMAQKDLLVSKGLKDAGYEYVIVDDCWSNMQRSADGKLVANSTSFPSGMKALSDYIHCKGLKFGMYADAGNLTCQNHPGSLGYEAVDAQSFAEWGVDYLKYDNCHANAQDGNVIVRYLAMSIALNNTGRPILYSIVGRGFGDPWRGLGQQYGNTWRTDGDITQSWPGIIRVLDNSVGLMNYSKPHAWADLDMLEVGVGALTFQEMRAHFALWALLKSPLMLGADLSTLSVDQLKLVSNREIIAVNQDELGVPGDQVWKEGPYEVYAAPMKDGSRVVCILNRHTLATQYKQENITVQWNWIGLPDDTKAEVRNILDQQDLGQFQGSFSGQVIVHDVLMVRITPVKPITLAKEWRPWSAQIYDKVKLEEIFFDTTNIILFVIFVGPGGLCIAVLIVMNIIAVARSCCQRCRAFRRSDEEGTPKSRASPPSRTTEMV